MTLPISYFRFFFPLYVLKTQLPPNCATGFFDKLKQEEGSSRFKMGRIKKPKKAKISVDKGKKVWYSNEAVCCGKRRGGKH